MPPSNHPNLKIIIDAKDGINISGGCQEEGFIMLLEAIELLSQKFPNEHKCKDWKCQFISLCEAVHSQLTELKKEFQEVQGNQDFG